MNCEKLLSSHTSWEKTNVAENSQLSCLKPLSVKKLAVTIKPRLII
jgi:hypothetical protein